MLFRRPCYYDSFTCTADKCTDSCCIGWEICIDADTADFYKGVGGALGERLKKSITEDDEPSFMLENERCPFLAESGLCDIICELGEDALCQICRDHPRWFEWYGNEKEGGIGLSCEEGARLILTDEGFADYFESEASDEPDEDFDEEAYRFLSDIREAVFDILCGEESFSERADKILELCAEAEHRLTGEEKNTAGPFDLNGALKKAVSVLEKAEPIDEKWTAEYERLVSLMPQLSPTADEEKYLTRLTAYFIWRYFLRSVFDYRITEKVNFALSSVTVIYALYSVKKERSFESLLRSAVLYSKQTEYSEENIELFFSQQ